MPSDDLFISNLGRRSLKHFNALFYGGISVSKSKVCLILSAFIYGFAPILAKFAYKSGANGITLTFFAYIP